MELTVLFRFAAIVALAACAAAAGSAAVIVQDGRACATIVVDNRAPADVREAAADLQAVLARVTGASLPVTGDPASAQGVRILVGAGAAKDAAARLGITLPTGLTGAVNEEGYVVAVDGDTVILAGNETPPYQGTVYAVYDLLDRIGCRWYMPGAFGEVLPKLATVRVDNVRHTVHPEFRVRSIWYSGWLATSAQDGADYDLWKRRNRMCRSELVGASYLPIPGDDTARYLIPKERYFEAHPEYYSLNADGTRNPDFLCMSNAGAFEAAVGTIEDRFRSDPNLLCFSFSPPDAPTLCHCPDCKKSMHEGFGGEGWGEVSDTYFDFVMRLAARIAKDCPGKWITSMAYFNRCRPPAATERRQDNLLMYLASIQQCPVHSYADDHCWSRRMFRDMLHRWSELSAGLVYYEYDPHDWSMFQRPAWRSDGIADDLRLLKSAGGWGFNDEGQNAWLSTGLNYYVRARLAWNLREDPARMVRDFCERFFGPAADPMHAFYTAVERTMRDTRIDNPHDADYAAVWTRPQLDRCLASLEQAGRAASAEPYRSRVAAFRAFFDRLDAYCRAHDARARADYVASAACGDEMVRTVERVGNPSLLQDHGSITPGNCSGAGVATFSRKMAEYTGGSRGRLLVAFPDTAAFRTDLLTEGITAGWFRPDLPSAGWRSIRMSVPWYNQGVVGPGGRRFKGVGWYRVQVDIPAAAAGGPVRILLPLVRGVATVWCNGTFAGHLPEKRPAGDAIVDVTGMVRAGRNLVAVRVAGEGGLALPPVVFAPANP